MRIPVGKYRGAPLTLLPTHYLEWLTHCAHDPGRKTEGKMNFDDDTKPLFLIAATVWDGEPRYTATITDKGHFDYLRIVRGYAVLTNWNGQFGTLLVSRDEEAEHDTRRWELGKITLADLRGGIGGLIAEVVAEFDLMKRKQ
jgi:hypothetical protein